jgi:hypothetical protein
MAYTTIEYLMHRIKLTRFRGIEVPGAADSTSRLLRDLLQRHLAHDTRHFLRAMIRRKGCAIE